MKDGGVVIAIKRDRVRNAVILSTAAGAAVYVLVGLPAQAEAAPGSLRLLAASNHVVLNRIGNNPEVELDLGAHLATDQAPFEIRLNRKSYNDPVEAVQVIRNGDKETLKALPRGLVKDFGGFAGMTHVTITDAQGKKVYDRLESFCPNSYSAGRIRQDAPADNKYPEGCPGNAFTVGSVWGIERGWAAPATGYGVAKLAVGKYTAKIEVTKRYREIFGIKDGAKTIKVTVRKAKPGEGLSAAAKARANAPVQSHALHNKLRFQGKGDALAKRHPKGVAKPKAAPPTGASRVPEGPKPDLRSLPAFDVKIIKERPKPGAAKREYMSFSATVWNGGQSPLIVDGFRRMNTDKMDAYQYFYDAGGKEVGHARTGDFQWDPRTGHWHWHFLDFAQYSLLGADMKQVVRSQKEAFCLVNTDAVDYTIPNAKWRPGNNDLRSSCGFPGSVSLREVLDVGSGDTYDQSLPGQSFDISKLKNGTYYIKVLANPVRKLHESNVNNNVALRKVIISGRPGARKVKVPPVGLVNTP